MAPRRMTARVALTFEAGGDPAPARAILEALDAAHVEATFFLDGRWAEHGWSVASASSLILKSQSESVTYCGPQNPGVDLIHGQGRGQSEAGPLTAPSGSANGAGT